MLAPTFVQCAVLVATPALCAMRILPLGIALPIAWTSFAVTQWWVLRGGIFTHDVTDGVATGNVIATALQVATWSLLPLLIDRACATWLRRWGFLAFPSAAVALAGIADVGLAAPVARALHNPVHSATLAGWSNTLSTPLVAWCMWLLASMNASVASGGFGTWRRRHPYTQAEREAGIAVASRVGVAVFLWMFAGGALWRWCATVPAGPAAAHVGDGVVVVAGLATLALLAAATMVWRRDRHLVHDPIG